MSTLAKRKWKSTKWVRHDDPEGLFNMNTVVGNMFDEVYRVFAPIDGLTLVVVFLIVIAAGVLLGEARRIAQVTLIALSVYGAFLLIKPIGEGAHLESLMGIGWNGLSVLSAADLIVHFFVFCCGIAIVHAAKHVVLSVVGRG